MSQINPFTGSILQAPQVQRQQATDKDQHLRRASDLSKNSALQEDQLEHQVESSDAIAPVHEDDQKNAPQKRKPARHPNSQSSEVDADESPRLDLTA
jgi:hypothetical protein